ncbi:hypothetical protein ElyMa_004424500 [Elysia marginata]|uniref:Uncharacterized protein n=1 Tax=Elysia marginata TaxID=1093978 RepID=A0AAV4HE14_9GAST|nr:hypothetical protein ElyMa_004424500 [Elysia marginata]
MKLIRVQVETRRDKSVPLLPRALLRAPPPSCFVVYLWSVSTRGFSLFSSASNVGLEPEPLPTDDLLDAVSEEVSSLVSAPRKNSILYIFVCLVTVALEVILEFWKKEELTWSMIWAIRRVRIIMMNPGFIPSDNLTEELFTNLIKFCQQFSTDLHSLQLHLRRQHSWDPSSRNFPVS